MLHICSNFPLKYFHLLLLTMFVKFSFTLPVKLFNCRVAPGLIIRWKFHLFSGRKWFSAYSKSGWNVWAFLLAESSLYTLSQGCFDSQSPNSLRPDSWSGLNVTLRFDLAGLLFSLDDSCINTMRRSDGLPSDSGSGFNGGIQHTDRSLVELGQCG